MPLQVSVVPYELKNINISQYVDYRSKMDPNVLKLLDEYPELEKISKFLDRNKTYLDTQTPSFRNQSRVICDVISKCLSYLEVELFGQDQGSQLAHNFFSKLHNNCVVVGFYMSLTVGQAKYSNGQKGGYDLFVNSPAATIMDRLTQWDIVSDNFYTGSDQPPFNIRDSLEILLNNIVFERIR